MKENWKKDFQNRIVAANRKELLLIHFEMLIMEIEALQVGLQTEDFAVLNGKTIAYELLKKMVEALDFRYEISYNLWEYYKNVNRLLLMGVNKRDKQPLQEAKCLLQELHDTFAQIEMKEDLPVLQNSEMVYAGLTYSKNNQLNESVDFQRRGYQV